MIDIKKVIFILLPIIISPFIIIFFSIMYLIQPTIAGYDIFQLMKLTNYIFLPIFYLIYGLILLLKYKPSISKNLVIGLLVFSLFYILIIPFVLIKFIIPTSSQVAIEGLSDYEIFDEYVGIFRNFTIINLLYVSEIIGLFVSQFVEKTYLKVIIFLISTFAITWIITWIIFNPLIFPLIYT